MKLLIAVDSAISTDMLVGVNGVRPWPDGTTAHVLSVVADADVPEELWREEGCGKRAVLREMEKRGEQITALAVERLREIGIPGEVVITRGDRIAAAVDKECRNYPRTAPSCALDVLSDSLLRRR
jgi:Trk K+ transport system NAD-binding subunit